MIKLIHAASHIQWPLSHSGVFRPIWRTAHRTIVKIVCWIYQHGYKVRITKGIYLRLDPEFLLSRTSVNEDILLDTMIGHLSPGDIVIDIGGWVGIYALCAAQIVGAVGKVYVFEPALESYNLLTKHIKMNHSEQTVFSFQQACGVCDEKGFLTNYPLSSENRIISNSTLISEGNDDTTIAVDVTSLDNFCMHSGIVPTHLKIDTEGAELLVLRGSQKILTQHRPIVFCELHPTRWGDFETTEEQITEFLNSINYHMDVAGARAEVIYTVMKANEQ